MGTVQHLSKSGEKERENEHEDEDQMLPISVSISLISLIVMTMKMICQLMILKASSVGISSSLSSLKTTQLQAAGSANGDFDTGAANDDYDDRDDDDDLDDLDDLDDDDPDDDDNCRQQDQ